MKAFYIVLLSAFLMLLTVFVCKNYVELKPFNNINDTISFEVKYEGKTETIKLWQNDEGDGFVFLPSYAELVSDVMKIEGVTSVSLLEHDGDATF